MIQFLKQECLHEAAELKLEGNDEFRAQRWNDALATYRRALGRLPKRQTLQKPIDREKTTETERTESEDDDNMPEEVSPKREDTSSTDDHLIEPSALEQECSNARAVLNANIAACYVKLVRMLTR